MCLKSEERPRRNPITNVQIDGFTREEVSKHNRRNSCWLIIDNNVYDVSNFVANHPGGELLILDVAGRDVTDPFNANHGTHVIDKYLPMFHIGFVSDPQEPVEEVKRYRQLFEKFKRENWFQTDYTFYYKMITWYVTLFLSSLYFVSQNSPVIAGLLMGFFWQQVAFMGHDCGHNSITHNRNFEIKWISHVLVAAQGISVLWWKASHNVHHLTTNCVEYDPDIQHLPVIAVSSKFFNDIYSLYHEKVFPFKNDRIAQFFVKRQHYLYMPIMCIARFNLYVQSIIFWISARKNNKRGRSTISELLALGVFWCWLITLLCQFPTVNARVTFMLCAHAMAGLLHVQIGISHFGLPVIEKKEGQTFDACQNFVKHQMATSMDVDCPPYLDWFHGGLQFQTVHHCFPRLPRHRLREATELLKRTYSDEPHGTKYVSMSWFDAIMCTQDKLKLTADQVSDFVNAIG